MHFVKILLDFRFPDFNSTVCAEFASDCNSTATTLFMHLMHSVISIMASAAGRRSKSRGAKSRQTDKTAAAEAASDGAPSVEPEMLNDSVLEFLGGELAERMAQLQFGGLSLSDGPGRLPRSLAPLNA